MLSWHNWMEQARRSFHAGELVEQGSEHFMACFSYQQAAEMALKAGLEALGLDHQGHYLPGLLSTLAARRGTEAPDGVAGAARRLNRLYIPTRYPDAEGGVPAENYDADDSARARSDAQRVIEYVESGLVVG
jgi:HEPN domain-containing protein